MPQFKTHWSAIKLELFVKYPHFIIFIINIYMCMKIFVYARLCACLKHLWKALSCMFMPIKKGYTRINALNSLSSHLSTHNTVWIYIHMTTFCMMLDCASPFVGFSNSILNPLWKGASPKSVTTKHSFSHLLLSKRLYGAQT